MFLGLHEGFCSYQKHQRTKSAKDRQLLLIFIVMHSLLITGCLWQPKPNARFMCIMQRSSRLRKSQVTYSVVLCRVYITIIRNNGTRRHYLHHRLLTRNYKMAERGQDETECSQCCGYDAYIHTRDASVISHTSHPPNYYSKILFHASLLREIRLNKLYKMHYGSA